MRNTDLYLPHVLSDQRPRTRSQVLADQAAESTSRKAAAERFRIWWLANADKVRANYADSVVAPTAAEIRATIADGDRFAQEFRTDGNVGPAIGLHTTNKQEPVAKGKQTRSQAIGGANPPKRLPADPRNQPYRGTALDHYGMAKFAAILVRCGVYGHPGAPVVSTTDRNFRSDDGNKEYTLKGRPYGDHYATWLSSPLADLPALGRASNVPGDSPEDVYNYLRSMLLAIRIGLGRGIDMGRCDARAGKRKEGTAVKTQFDPLRTFTVEDLTQDLAVHSLDGWKALADDRVRGNGYWRFRIDNIIRKGHGWTFGRQPKRNPLKMKGTDGFICKALDRGLTTEAIADHCQRMRNEAVSLTHIETLRAKVAKYHEKNPTEGDLEGAYDLPSAEPSPVNAVSAREQLDCLEVFAREFMTHAETIVWGGIKRGLSTREVVEEAYSSGVGVSERSVEALRRRLELALSESKLDREFAGQGSRHVSDIDRAWADYAGRNNVNRRRNALWHRGDMDASGNRASQKAVKSAPIMTEANRLRTLAI